jgi:hypothetical protein
MAEQNATNQQLRDNPEEQYRLLTENVKDFAVFLIDRMRRRISRSEGIGC